MPNRAARARLAPLLPCLVLLAACEVSRSGDDTRAGAAVASRDSAAGAADPNAIGFAIDSAYAVEVALTPDLRGDTSWRAAAEADRRVRHPDAAPTAVVRPSSGSAAAVPGTPATTGATPAPAAADSALAVPLTPERVNAAPQGTAAGGAGPLVLRAQILLDQAGFSPGVVDGTWGGNTGKAAFWFQDANGLPTTGVVDAATFARLRRATGDKPALVRYAVTEADVAGPFQQIPESPYAQAKLPCLCYRNAMELLAERHHTTAAALARLNPGLDTTRVAAGTQLWVPHVRRPIVAQRADTGALARRFAEPTTATNGAGGIAAMPDSVAGPGDARATERGARRDARPSDTARGEAGDVAGLGDSVPARAVRADSARAFGTPQVARIVVSLRGSYLHALDAQGRILLHAPTTLGSQLDSTPAGALRVTRVAYQPDFHYNPKLYAEIPDTRPGAHLPPGPNSPVGVMWMALDKPNYGIHGSNAPETVGYARSHGCVRLTNWDARWLADRTPSGVTVEFR